MSVFHWHDCVGIFYTGTIFGPVVAFIVGGLLLEMYTHFDTIDMETSVETLHTVLASSSVKKALIDDDVRLFVCLSVASRASVAAAYSILYGNTKAVNITFTSR